MYRLSLERHHLARGEDAPWGARPLIHFDELAGLDAMLELGPDRRERERAHPQSQRIAEQRPFVDDRRALEIAVLPERHRRVRRDSRHVRRQVVRSLLGRAHYVGGLIAEGVGHLAVLAPHLVR
jgi:hypothetical protein